MYKFFPGSQSNKLYELATGIKVRAVIPDKGHSGKRRLSWLTKWQICAVGVSLGLGLLILFISAILLSVNGCEEEAKLAWYTFGTTLVVKLPECFMYYLLQWAIFIDHSSVFFGALCCFGIFG